MIDAPSPITAGESEIIEDGLRLLKPFFKITEEMSAEKVVTLSKVIQIKYCLSLAARDLKSDSAVGSFLQQSLSRELSERFDNLEEYDCCHCNHSRSSF